MTDNLRKPRLEAQTANERPHVLIVSDDPDLVDFLANGLPMGGFWTSVIASGLQALEVFKLRQFDLIVLDWELSNFLALEFLRRLRGVSELEADARPRTDRPVVTISSHAVDPQGTEGLGVAACLAAPIELPEIVQSLHQVFNEWRADHPDVELADASAMRAF